MSRKTVAIKMSPIKAAPPTAADAWIEAAVRETTPPPVLTVVEAAVEPMKRFTIDVSEGLHKRIKAECAMRGQKMADVIRELLDTKFPAKS